MDIEELDEVYVPKRALVLYTSNRNGRYLEMTDIKNNALRNNRPASKRMIGNMLKDLESERDDRVLTYKGFIPEDLLLLETGKGKINFVQRTEPRKANLIFKKEMFPSGEYHIPGLVFVQYEGSRRVFAYLNWQGMYTILYRAPFLNVNDGNSLCVGSSLGGLRADTANEYIEQYIDRFFNSEFSELQGEPTKCSYEDYLKHTKYNYPTASQHLRRSKTRLEDICRNTL
jgi:hypothetical protein